MTWGNCCLTTSSQPEMWLDPGVVVNWNERCTSRWGTVVLRWLHLNLNIIFHHNLLDNNVDGKCFYPVIYAIFLVWFISRYPFRYKILFCSGNYYKSLYCHETKAPVPESSAWQVIMSKLASSLLDPIVKWLSPSYSGPVPWVCGNNGQLLQRHWHSFSPDSVSGHYSALSVITRAWRWLGGLSACPHVMTITLALFWFASWFPSCWHCFLIE